MKDLEKMRERIIKLERENTELKEENEKLRDGYYALKLKYGRLRHAIKDLLDEFDGFQGVRNLEKVYDEN